MHREANPTRGACTDDVGKAGGSDPSPTAPRAEQSTVLAGGSDPPRPFGDTAVAAQARDGTVLPDVDDIVLPEAVKCPHDCYGNGYCMNGKCQCKQGFTGKYCENGNCRNNCEMT